jgi:hypothetical protein
MNAKDFVVAAQAELANLVDATKSFFEAHPDIESDAATTLKQAAVDAAPLVETEVQHEAPPTIAAIVDSAIAAEAASLEASITAMKAESDKKVAALQSLKPLLA